MTIYCLLLIVVTLAVLQGSINSKTTRQCPRDCSCTRRKPKMYCSGKRSLLTTIPRAPAYIREVWISRMKLGSVTRNMVANLTHCKLKSLHLENNIISSIEDDAFKDLKHIVKLVWREKYISVQDIRRGVSSISKDLQRLYIKAERSNAESMNSTMFRKFQRLSRLHISLQTLIDFDANGLTHLLNLRRLDLSRNKLRRIRTSKVIYNLMSLNLKWNNFEKMPQLCKSGLPTITPRLQSLNIENNVMRNLEVTTLKCLHNLQKLTLTGNRIEVLPDNAFASLPRLASLHMAKLPLKQIGNLAFNSSSLRKLYFAKIPILTIKKFDPAEMFKHTPNLKYLNMISTKLKINEVYWKKFLLNLRNIRKLVLQTTNLNVLPSSVFSKLTKLKILVLSGNPISSWRSDVFQNVTSVKKIDLDGCNIKIINEDSFPWEFRQNIKKINLANNPFICTCDLLWFRNWMKEAIANKSITFLNTHRYVCRAPNVKNLRLKDFNPTAESCKTLEWYVIFLPIFFSSILVFCTAGLVIYRYRWYFFYWISLVRRRRARAEIPLREIMYDAFVSHSNSDNDWVYDELLHYLEVELGHRLCEHSRDFEGGKLIIDNVFQALDTSHKTILVISNEYMKSDWCQFELQMALNSFYRRETDLVVVMLEPIKPRHVTSTLRALMTSTTYIEWSQDEMAKTLFWERIKNCLKK